jgi:hypothetical protein
MQKALLFRTCSTQVGDIESLTLPISLAARISR